MIEYFKMYGILTFVLPFLIIFSLVFLLLEITKLLKKDDNDITGRKIHAILSIGFALTALGNPTMVNWMISLIPNATIWLLGIFLFVLAMSFLFGERVEIPSWLRFAIALIIIGSLVVIGANALVGQNIIQIGAIDYSVIATLTTILIIFAILIAIISWIFSGQSETTETQRQQ